MTTKWFEHQPMKGNKEISTKQIRKDLAESLLKYGMTVDEFLQTDIDDLPDWNLRDTKLMLRGVFEEAKQGDKQ